MWVEGFVGGLLFDKGYMFGNYLVPIQFFTGSVAHSYFFTCDEYVGLSKEMC